jgi:hypothetical protein
MRESHDRYPVASHKWQAAKVGFGIESILAADSLRDQHGVGTDAFRLIARPKSVQDKGDIPHTCQFIRPAIYRFGNAAATMQQDNGRKGPLPLRLR